MSFTFQNWQVTRHLVSRAALYGQLSVEQLSDACTGKELGLGPVNEF